LAGRFFFASVLRPACQNRVMCEVALSEDTVNHVLLGGRHFERIPSDAGLEWLFCLASALQASQYLRAPNDASPQKNAQAATTSAIDEG
jgi:hypothetical protein